MASLQEEIVHSEEIFDGRVVHLRLETVARCDGHTYQREVIYHNGALAMVALDEDDNIMLVRQYRAGVKGHLLELPAGGLEPGESREDCARRELQEEIGYYPEQLTELGGFYVAASYTTEFITIYLARGILGGQIIGSPIIGITRAVVMGSTGLVQMLYHHVVTVPHRVHILLVRCLTVPVVHVQYGILSCR